MIHVELVCSGVEMPEFVERHPVLRAAWEKKWKESIEPSFDIKHSILVPHNDPTESKLDKVLDQQRFKDVEGLLELSKYNGEPFESWVYWRNQQATRNIKGN